MTVYWVLFAYAALLALSYPVAERRSGTSAVQALSLSGFVLFYALIAGLRYETGGDWETYANIHETIRTGTIADAFTATDPLFGLLNWASAQVDGGVYLVNGLCAVLLGYGVVKAALRLRDPWLAIMMAVPYLLIVVGMGYVRQGAAIGLILIAIASFDQSRPLRTGLYLLLAFGFHSTSVVVLPLFAYAVTTRYRFAAIGFAAVAAASYMLLLAPRLENFEAGYLEAEYESSGATVRILMSVLPSALLLLRWRNFAENARIRSIWITMAIANVIVLGALLLSPSSTAVDRLALFFAPIQMAVYGEFRDLVSLPRNFAVPVRLTLIGIAAMVQVIWLVFATHSIYWVPYQSILQFL